MGQGQGDTTASAGVTRLHTARIAERAHAHEALLAVAQIVADGTAVAAGYRSTTRFLQDTLRVNPTESQRLIDRAALLAPRVAMSGEPLPPLLPATAEANAAGVLNEGHLAVILATVQCLEQVPGIDPDALDDAERALVHFAGTLAPAGLDTVARRLIATADPDGAAPDDPPEPDDELPMLRRRNGTLALTGRVRGAADVEAIVEVFDALATPAGPDDTRTQAQRFAEVLKELVAQALSPTGIATDTLHSNTPEPERDDYPDPDPDPDPDHADRADRADRAEEPGEVVDLDQREADPTRALDDLPRSAAATKRAGRAGACPKVTVSGRALLAVTIDHRWLQAQIGHGLLDSDRAVDPATARRLACDAGVIPIVLGSRGEPLDVGRLSYTVPEGMRRALHHRDGRGGSASTTMPRRTIPRPHSRLIITRPDPTVETARPPRIGARPAWPRRRLT